MWAHRPLGTSPTTRLPRFRRRERPHAAFHSDSRMEGKRSASTRLPVRVVLANGPVDIAGSASVLACRRDLRPGFPPGESVMSGYRDECGWRPPALDRRKADKSHPSLKGGRPQDPRSLASERIAVDRRVAETRSRA